MVKDETASAVSKCCGAGVEEQTLLWCKECSELCNLSEGEGNSLAATGVTLPSPSVQYEEIEKIIEGWEKLSKLVYKNEKTWDEHCIVGAGRYMEITKILPYIRSLESRNKELEAKVKVAEWVLEHQAMLFEGSRESRELAKQALASIRFPSSK